MARYATVSVATAIRDEALGDSPATMQPSLISRLDHRDRALFLRVVISASTPRSSATLWRFLTHIGGFWASVSAVFAPMLLSGGTPASQMIAFQAAVALLLSHLIVQLVKRRVIRERPCTQLTLDSLVVVPDKFSFPSGHSCAIMSVAFVHAVAYPWLAWPLFLLSTMVGISRVRLGVHYPGDVVAGQAIAIATGVLVMGLR